MFLVLDGLDQHFGRKPGLLQDMWAGAEVNALLQLKNPAFVIQIGARMGDHASIEQFQIRKIAAFPTPAFGVCMTDLRLAIENRFHGVIAVRWY